MPRTAPTPTTTPAGRPSALETAAIGPVLDLLGDAVLVFELAEEGPTRIVAANAAAVALYGYTPDELIGLVPAELVVSGGIRSPDVLLALRRDGRAAAQAVHRTRDGRHVDVEVTLGALSLNGGLAAVATVRDVSARRVAEAALRESEERLRVALSAAPLVLTRVGRDLRYEWLFDPRPGSPRVDAGTPAGVMLPDVEAGAYRAALTRAMDLREVVQETMTMSTRDGPRDFRMTIAPVDGPDGEVVGATVAAYDVTELRRTEDALRASEERLRLAQRAARIGTWEADPVTGQATWSEGMWELVGVEPRELPDRALWRSLIHPDDAARAASTYEAALARGDTFSDEFRLVRPDDGSIIWVASRGRVIRDGAGRPVRVLGVNFDITDRRITEEALRSSEERSAMAQRAARVGTWEVGIGSGDVTWSEGIWELLGVEPGSVEQTYEAWTSFVHPEDRDALLTGFENALAKGDDWAADFRVLRPDDTMAWVSARGRVVRDEEGRPLRMVGVSVDITDRRAAEAAVRAGAEEIRRFADAMPQLAFIAEAPRGEPPVPIYYNEQWYTYTGMERSGSFDTGWAAYLHEDDLAAAHAEQVRSASTGTPFELEYRFRRHDGQYRWFLGRAAPVAADDDGVVRWFGTCTDIHDLKAAEAALADANARLEGRVQRRTAALLASQARLEGVLQTSLDAVTVGESVRDEGGVIRDFRWQLVNPAAGALFGRAVDELQGRTPDDAGVTFRGTEMFELHRRVVETGEPARDRIHFAREGLSAWLDVQSVKLGDGYAATFRDVTAQVEAEEALRDSETRFRLLVEGIPDYAIFLLDVEGRVISWNAGAERMKGHTAEEALGRHLSEFYDPENAEGAYEELRQAEAEGRSEGEGWRQRRDGSTFWASTVLTSVRDESGRLTGFARLTRDDTRRRASEQALRASEERFRSLFASTPIGVAVVDVDGVLKDANPALCTFVERPAAELVGKPLLDLTHPADRRLVEPLFDDLLAGRRDTFEIEGRYARGSGGDAWAQTTASVVRDGEGSPLYVVASVADVTERRELEQAAIEAAEAERRRLSYELHDDLAQRLAGASVLSHTLAEQLSEDAHPGSTAALRLGDLVRDAMAHARALSRALAPVDLLSEGLAEALERLCASTQQAYGVDCMSTASADTHVANPAVATHLFRIAQEATSNAARHAGATEIRIALEGRPEALTLSVSDNGAGIPSEAVGTTSGLGLRTMRARAAALGGTLALRGSPEGTTVLVTVPRHGPADP